MTETTTEKKSNRTDYTEAAAAKLRQQMADVMENHTTACVLLASKLFDVYYGTVKQGGVDVPLAVAWGHDNFDEYVEHELGIHQGTARVYVGVFDELYCRRKFEPGQLPNSISKLKGLARVSRRVANASELKPWFDRAAKLSCCEFDAEVDKLIHGKTRRRNVSVAMTWTGAKSLYAALDSAKEAYGVPTKGEALLAVIEDWRARTADGAAPTRRRRAS
jgi:hypothetical protein